MFSIQLSKDELDIIGKALGSAPYNVVAPLIDNINRQIAIQQMPPAPPAPPESAEGTV